jgi:hypothetical protein
MSSSVRSSCSSKHSLSDARISIILDDSATVDDLREAVTTLEDADRIAKRVLGSAYGFVANIEATLRKARAVLRAREAGESVVFVESN